MTPEINAEYAAKGWPSVDPRSPDYCYQPCRYGLHVCGHHPDGLNCLTIVNVPARTATEARALFERAKSELAAPEGEDADLVVDLNIDHDCDEDFMMHRQMLDRLVAMGTGQ